MKSVEWIKLAGSSLGGNIVLSEVLCGLPMYLIFLPIIYQQGDLTLSWALVMAFRAAL